MKNLQNLKVLGVVVLLGAGVLLAGCKSAPVLTPTQAQAQIQAKYDQTPPVGATIVLNKEGLGMGITDGYWKLTRVYPNKYWADYTLTDAGKKAVAPQGGGDVIQWRPSSPTDSNYFVTVTTVAANHLKANDVQNIQSEVLPGVDVARSVQFDEDVDLTGVPGPLLDIAHNPGNRLSTSRQADFALVNGVWTLKAIN